MLLTLVLIFIVGYLAIILEHPIRLNKAASAIITGMLCWTVYILMSQDKHLVGEQLNEHLGEIAGILFFLMGAMTIVELIDGHDGFDVITNSITTLNKKKLLWIICALAFILSAVLDNLTTTIVLVSLLRKLVTDKKERMLFVGMVVVSANAGGAWSPIGDVTTTMLWIGGQISAGNIILKLFIPGLVCALVPVAIASFMLKGSLNKRAAEPETNKPAATRLQRNVIFFSGLGILLLVPVFKSFTHLPPFVGMLLGLGILWVISEILHKDKDESEKGSYSVLHALRKIDTPSLLFFLGILIAIAAIQSTGLLKEAAGVLNEKIGNMNAMVLIIGLLSAVIDNVPLVAASMGMYDLTTFETDHYFWVFLAYCAGTGGSALIIGSASGVVAMGMEKINFFWYLKKISWLAVIGYFAGAFVFILQEAL